MQRPRCGEGSGGNVSGVCIVLCGKMSRQDLLDSWTLNFEPKIASHRPTNHKECVCVCARVCGCVWMRIKLGEVLNVSLVDSFVNSFD